MSLSLLAAAAVLAASSSPMSTPVVDVHSFGNPSVVRPTHLVLDLGIDFEKMEIRGTCELRLSYPGKGARQVVLESIETAKAKA